MPCNPNDISLNIPSGPLGPAIPGFGIPFSLSIPSINPFPSNFPEDLLELFNKLQLLIPSGVLKPQLNPNFGKDVFDGIMKLLDQFMPFLLLYRFFLPVLNIIICIIEVLCSLLNPFKLISALNRLFNQCIPAFINVFPIFALIIMIISLLLLILALIEYVIEQVIKFIKVILRNISALNKAFNDNDKTSVLAIARKLGSILCMFQNLFVLFAIFNIIIQVIRDMLSQTFGIPPCDDTDPSNQDGCCTPDVCPSIVKGDYTSNTGIFKYLPQVSLSPHLSSPILPQFSNLFNFTYRNESWQLYDLNQPQAKQFRNIFDGYDIPFSDKPIFFPTDVTYSAKTAPRQAAYKFDLRMFYNPISWGRHGLPRFIRFNNCILTQIPSTNLQEGDLSIQNVFNAVATLAGGSGFEDDNKTILKGYSSDGYTVTNDQATLENFVHMPMFSSENPVVNFSDGYVFSNMTYTFKPNMAILLQKNLVTAGCEQSLAFNRVFVNNIFAGDIGLKTQLLNNLFNGTGGGGNNFPNPDATQQCLSMAVTALRINLTANGAALFQASVTACLQKLKDDTNSALHQLIGIGFDPCKSSYTATPTTQFTSKPIKVSVSLNERNGLPLTNGLSNEVAINLAARIKPHITFGSMDNFIYDGYQVFTSNLTSDIPGTGKLMISFDNNIFCTNTFPKQGDPGTAIPVHSLQSIDYQFIYTPVGTGIGTGISGEESDGKARRDEGDLARDGS